MRTVPRCDTSNTAADRRHAMCSSSVPVYSSGMSQPPNSTMRAPSERCTASSGDVRVTPGSSLGGGDERAFDAGQFGDVGVDLALDARQREHVEHTLALVEDVDQF